MEHTKSQAAFEEARQYIPGGVNSPVRSFRSVGGVPPFISGGKGSKVGIGQGIPVLGKDLPRRKAAGRFCGFQCTLQVGSGGGTLGGRCQLGAAQQYTARVHSLGCQQVLCLRRKRVQA